MSDIFPGLRLLIFGATSGREVRAPFAATATEEQRTHGRHIMDDLERVEQKHGLRLPEAYRSMQAAGWLDVEASENPDYFWLSEAEWMPLDEIADYQPEEYHKPGFVPFASEGDGSHWCWWPSVHPGKVVLCPRDCEEGEFYAPSFTGFLYRRLLDYARCVSDKEEHEIRQYLRASATRLSRHLPTLWKDTLNDLASAQWVQQFSPNGREVGLGLLTQERYQEIVQRDLTFPLLDQVFEWMHPLTEDEAETAAIWREVIEADPTSPIEDKMARVEAEKARQRVNTL